MKRIISYEIFRPNLPTSQVKWLRKSTLSVSGAKSAIKTTDDTKCLQNKIIGFIGGGKITGCMIKSLIHAGHPKDQIIVSNRSKGKLNNLKTEFGVTTAVNNTEVVQTAHLVILAVKSPMVESVAKEIKSELLYKNPLMISLAPGISIADLKALLGVSNIVRAMTNTATAISKGSSVLYTPSETDDDLKKMAEMVFRKVGKALWLNEERGIDTITPLIISSAYLYLMVEAIERAAVSKGISYEIARAFSEQVFIGAAASLDQTQKPASQLREEITTPNGVTEQAIKVFTAANIFSLFEQAFEKAEQRSLELGKTISSTTASKTQSKL